MGRFIQRPINPYIDLLVIHHLLASIALNDDSTVLRSAIASRHFLIASNLFRALFKPCEFLILVYIGRSFMGHYHSVAFSAFHPDLLVPVDKNHPEVKTRVREAINKAKLIPVELDVNLYVDAVRAAVEEAEEQLRVENTGGPL